MTAAARLQARIDQRTLWDVEADIREVLAENARLQDERDQARAMARYAYARWPAPIFWQAAAEIDDPYTQLPDWLTDEKDVPR